MRLRPAAILFALALTTLSAPAAAYRPFDSTDAAVAERGEFEAEIGPLGYIRVDRRNFFAPMQVLNLGFADRFELVLQGREFLPADVDSHTRIGLGDTSLTVKSVLRPGVLQDKPGISIAAEVGPLLPTIHDEPGAGAIADVIASDRFSFGTFHLNVQGAVLRDGNPDLFVGLISEGPWEWKLRPVTELFVEREFGERTTFSALAGIIGKMTEEYDLDAALRYAAIDGQPVVEVRAGFTWRIGLW
jgi:hypothetical protein